MKDGRSWPADKVERRNIKSIIPYARNSRTHSDEQVAQIAASIKEWGFTNPILVDVDGEIIAGHGRLLAAQKLGLDEVPCITAVGWSDAQKKAYVIADNKLALNAGWDNDMLSIEFAELLLLLVVLHSPYIRHNNDRQNDRNALDPSNSMKLFSHRPNQQRQHRSRTEHEYCHVLQCFVDQSEVPASNVYKEF